MESLAGQPTKSQGGFTLLEVLIALAILSGVIVTIITVLNSHLAASTRFSDTATATLIAREKLEEALLTGVPQKYTKEFDGYSLDYQVDDAGAGLDRVCAIVVWGKDEKVSVCSYAAKKN